MKFSDAHGISFSRTQILPDRETIVLYNFQIWSRFYIRKTTIDWDVDYFDRFIEHHTDTDPGLGVFQNCDDKFDIKIVGVDIVSVKKTLLHPLQKRYHIESREWLR